MPLGARRTIGETEFKRNRDVNGVGGLSGRYTCVRNASLMEKKAECCGSVELSQVDRRRGIEDRRTSACKGPEAGGRRRHSQIGGPRG